MAYPDTPLASSVSFSQVHAGMNGLERFVFWLAILSFFIFFVAYLYFGGDAISGKVEDGRYYLKNEGLYTEVGRPVFLYMKWHAASLFLTHPVGIAAAFIARNRVKTFLEQAHD